MPDSKKKKENNFSSSINEKVKLEPSMDILNKADTLSSIKEKQQSIDEKAKIARASVTRRAIDQELIGHIAEQISDNKRVRKFFRPWGRVALDRQLPYICVYRKRPNHTKGDESLVTGEAAYLLSDAKHHEHSKLKKLVSEIAIQNSEKFGSFLVIEIWITPFLSTEDMAALPPKFQIYKPPGNYPQIDTTDLENGLKRINVQKQGAEVDTVWNINPNPEGTISLVGSKEAKQNNIYVLGLEVSDVYRDSKTKEVFPQIKQRIWRGLSRTIKRFVFDFTQKNTSYRPPNYQALGNRKLLKAVWEIDTKLAMISQSFDLVLAVTPTNTKATFEEFKRRQFNAEPKFLYRPVSVQPNELKRLLFSINANRVEDPALIHLFETQQRGIESKINLLEDRNTEKFIYGSLQLYGKPSEDLVQIARHLLSSVPTRTRGESSKQTIGASEFHELASKEIEYYREKMPSMKARAMIQDDIAGVMVSDGNLLISKYSQVHKKRIYSLIHHEVGTHVLTYWNAKSQPFKQLYTGFVGYDELQEGFAVLSEYLCGGLTNSRIRVLAARVVAVQMRIDGAHFIETFRELVNRFRFNRRTAFTITARVYRGGGFTKDAVYLRGLIWILDYLATGGDIEPLLVGKLPQAQIPLINELLWREVLKPPILRPRFLELDIARDRMEKLRKGLSVVDLVNSD